LVQERGGTVFYGNGVRPSYLTSFLNDFAKVEKNRKCIVILEDIDALIEKFGSDDYLEMLDSAKSINNVLFIATSNYPERLDPRIYNRPGRFANVIKIGYPSPKMREAYLKAILKNHQDVEKIVAKTDGFTIDHLTSLINAVYRMKKDMDKEIDRLRILFKPPKSESKALGIGINQKADWEE
jgi:SpoVK/Ycf46/Vps4 family AAA+-type ATPase